MQVDDIKLLIEKSISCRNVQVSGDGCNVKALVVSDEFEGKTLLARQRMIYAALGDKISSGEIHAISINAYTPQQWEEKASE